MIELNFKAEGLEKALFILEELKAAGSTYSGIELIGKSRKRGVSVDAQDISKNNAEILLLQAGLGRDAISTTPDENERIAQAAADVFSASAIIEESYSKQLEDAKKRGNEGAIKKKIASLRAIKVLQAAMKEYMEIVTEHIEAESGAKGAFKPLSAKYRQRKLNDIGFTDMLRYTGQILENLDSTGLSFKNMRLLK
jgi:hypothetical protein